MGGNYKHQRKLSASDNANTLKQVPSAASGSQGSTIASTTSSGSVAVKSQPSSSTDNPPSSSSNITSGSQRPHQDNAAHPSRTTSSHQQNSAPHIRQRHGRSYIEAPGVTYPLPVDLPEMHRQSLRTMLLTEIHGAPLRAPMTKNPPRRVLEIGCGPGIWSLLCHRYFKKLGHTGISFVGIDIAPPSSGMMTPDPDMDWTYVQHDITNIPWPFPDEHFDLMFHKEMTLAVPVPDHPAFSAEGLRVTAHGGYVEIWEVDHMIRLLRPHTPNDQDRDVMKRGAYALNINTPLSAPQNSYLVEYNSWLTQAFEKRAVMVNPCTAMQHYLMAEDILTDVRSQRLLIPFSEIRWEGQGGVAKVVTKDGKAYVKGTTGGDATTSKTTAAASQKQEVKLTEVALAVRRTALLTLVQEIQAQELMLREVNGKGPDEWNSWVDKMTHDLMEEGGTRWGECLETGAWWARKKNVGE